MSRNRESQVKSSDLAKKFKIEEDFDDLYDFEAKEDLYADEQAYQKDIAETFFREITDTHPPGCDCEICVDFESRT